MRIDRKLSHELGMFLQITDKLVEKVGIQRTPAANPEMYKSDDYSAHLKGEHRTMAQRERDEAGEHPLGFFPDIDASLLKSPNGKWTSVYTT